MSENKAGSAFAALAFRCTSLEVHRDNYISARPSNVRSSVRVLWITCAEKRAPKSQTGGLLSITSYGATILSHTEGVNRLDAPASPFFHFSSRFVRKTHIFNH